MRSIAEYRIDWVVYDGEFNYHMTRVNARNTSRLAFDGSGWSKRGREITPDTPHAIMQFPNGKIYNADLNASYNIGARYFIRYLLKTVTVTQRLALEAKVPQVTKRSTCTLSHLINLRSELADLTAETQAQAVRREKEVYHQDEAETAEPDDGGAIQTEFEW